MNTRIPFAIAALAFVAGGALAQAPATKPTQPAVCNNCHKPAPGTVAGYFENVAFKSQSIQLGIVVPLLLQGLELGHRIPHTVVPALLVLAGGYTLRWLMVNAGQASEIVSTTAKF